VEANFRDKFQVLNRVRLTDAEFQRLLEEIVSTDVFAAPKTLRSINTLTRDDGTPVKFKVPRARTGIRAATAKHNEFLKELGSPSSPTPCSPYTPLLRRRRLECGRGRRQLLCSQTNLG
jgi:hypothetical protein